MPAGSKPGERRGGRKKGTPNKVTREVREVLKAASELLAPELAGWIRKVERGERDSTGKDWFRRPDPKGAAELTLSMLEFAAPKLARTEVSGSDGGPLVVKVILEK
jgi:hypothetical protein